MAWSGEDRKGVTNKEQILAKVRNAIIEKPEAVFKDIDQHSDTWVPISEEDGTAITFVQHFKDQGGIFIYLESEQELADCLRQLVPENEWEPLWCTSPDIQELLKKYGIPYTTGTQRNPKQKLVSITGCECLVAQTGSVVVSEAMTRSRTAYTLPDVHLIVARSEQIVPGLKEAFVQLQERYDETHPSQLAIITGISRTTDIEQMPIYGVNGAKQIAVFLVDE